MKPHRLVSVKPPDPKIQDQNPEKQLAERQRIVRAVIGVRSDDAASRLIQQASQALVWPPVNDEALLNASLCAIGEMRPQTALESMLSVQMIAVHNAALMFLSRATQENQYPESVERNLVLSNRCMRMFVNQVEALERLRGKVPQQVVKVQHVHVNEGGHAIVGAVSATAAPAKGEGG